MPLFLQIEENFLDLEIPFSDQEHVFCLNLKKCELCAFPISFIHYSEIIMPRGSVSSTSVGD